MSVSIIRRDSFEGVSIITDSDRDYPIELREADNLLIFILSRKESRKLRKKLKRAERASRDYHRSLNG